MKDALHCPSPEHLQQCGMMAAFAAFATCLPEQSTEKRAHFFCLIAALLLAFLLQFPAAHAQGIGVEEAYLEHSEEGYRFSVRYTLELNDSLKKAIDRGVPLYFTTEVEIVRPRWYWFDAKEVVRSQTIRISYNLLTRQYHAAMTGSLYQNFATLDEALSMVRRPNRWIVAALDELKPGQTYDITVRMQLDVALLPKPLQVHAINSSDWNLVSGWHRFSFTTH